MTMTYNYDRFRLDLYDLTKFPGPRAGEAATDFELHDIDGKTVRLSDYRGRWLVLETASATCMMYARNVEALNALRRRHADVNWLVLYVREAHPGERTGPHRSMKEKIRCARDTRSLYGEYRDIVVDTLEGEVHRAYGGLPNMVYVIDPVGKVIYRSDWLVVNELEDVLICREIEGKDHTFTSNLDYPGVWLTLKVLAKGGVVAAWDFLKAAPFLLSSHRRSDAAYAGDPGRLSARIDVPTNDGPR